MSKTATKYLLFLTLALSFVGFSGYYYFAPGEADSQPRSLKVLLDYQTAPSFIGFYVARSAGYYDKRNLRVEFVNADGAKDAAAQVAKGTYKVGTSSGQATLLLISQGGDLASLAVLYPRVPTVLVSRREDKITAPRDLIGKTIGINAASATSSDFKWLQTKYGISDSDIEVQGVGSEVAPLLAGQVDAILTYNEWLPYIMTDALDAMPLSKFGLDAYGFNIIANRSFASAQSSLIRDFTAATLEGYEYARANHDKAQEVYLELGNVVGPEETARTAEALERVIANLGAGPVGEQSYEGWERTIATARDSGLRVDLVGAERLLLGSP